MTSVLSALWRGRALLAAAGLALAAPSRSESGRSIPAGRPITIGQIFDSSMTQQDVSKDFLIGSRAAWQDINLKGGVRGHPVVHRSIEVDGTPASLGAAIDGIRDNPAYVALSGTAGDLVATRLGPLLRQENLAIAHVAPWLQNAGIDIDDRTFPIFAARQEQIAHALRSLSVLGVAEVGAIRLRAGTQPVPGRPEPPGRRTQGQDPGVPFPGRSGPAGPGLDVADTGHPAVPGRDA
ncbi:MAG TPA: hypothetical protein VN663_03120 [Ramlibacter sp.]|nr:hypothetical protein [Ramlibacter sp.]